MIQISNHAAIPFSGWKRTTVSEKPPFEAGVFADGTKFVLVSQQGLSTWVVDICPSLMRPDERRTYFFDDASPCTISVDPLPSEPLALFGVPTLNGVPFELEDLKQEGAGYRLQMKRRIGRMFLVRIWAIYRPSEPGLMTCEALIVASNGNVPDLTEQTPQEGLVIQWGNALCHVAGRWITNVLVPPGETFADGMARGFNFQLVWPALIEQQNNYLFGTMSGLVSACGQTKLYPQGNPVYSTSFRARDWVAARFMESLRRLHTWEPGVCGWNPRSADAGAQDDQIFVRGERLLPGGEGAEIVAYNSALKVLNRPCHHLEHSGVFADSNVHPNCMFWWGRPHKALPDRLGKVDGLDTDSGISYGWAGPDDEHWFYNTLFAASRLTGSDILQWEMSQQAHIFLFQETLPSQAGKAGWFTTNSRSARSVGWACLLAVYLYENLADRVLAERVKERIKARIREVYVVQLGPREVWDPRLDVPSLGPGLRWMPWQQAVGAYGLDVASKYFGVVEGIPVALAAAKKVLQDAVLTKFGRWVAMDIQTVEGSLTETPNTFFLFGFPLAAATVLKHEPQNMRAVSIWNQMVGDAQASGSTSWIPPEFTSF